MSTVIKKFAVDLHIRVGYGTAFFLLLISYLLTLYTNSELLKQARLVDRSNKTIIHMEGMLSSLKDMETSARGYLLFKDSHFLRPYNQSRHVTDSLFGSLQTETLNDTIIWQDLLTLKTLMDKNYDLVAANLNDFEQNQHQITEELRSRSFFREEIMDHIRATIKDMQSAEQSRLRGRLAEMNTRYHLLNAVIILSLVLAMAMAAYGFFTYTRENKARRIADEKVSGYQQQLKQQIAELDRANKELIQMRSIEKFASTGRIARTIAHEVRNPLTNINLAVDQLKSELNGNLVESYSMMLEMINRNSVRINQLITDLLNSTKFTDLVYKRISINQLLDETLELARDRILLNNISVVKHYSSDICDIAVDVERIKIAFLNIIVNAIEAMEPGSGILQLRTASKNDRCVVTITDNGRGIDPETQSNIFEPYYTTKNKSTGLGLTNTQNIILNHNGLITLESETGKGTTFTITLNYA